MKKLFVSVLVMCGLLVSASAYAQAKIGVVDADQVILKSAKGKKFMTDMDALAQQKKAAIDKVVSEAQALQKEYQSKAASLSEDKRVEMEKRLSDYQIQVKRMNDDAKRELNLKQQEQLEKFRKMLQPIVEQLAKERGLDVVFSRAQSGIVYLSPAVDLTDEVIKRFDAQ